MPDFARNEAKAWGQKTIRDFYMCPLTPMSDSLEPDVKGMHENIDAYVDMGLNGLVVGGFISECWNMTLSQWMRYHEVVAEANAGRLDLWTIILDPRPGRRTIRGNYIQTCSCCLNQHDKPCCPGDYRS